MCCVNVEKMESVCVVFFHVVCCVRLVREWIMLCCFVLLYPHLVHISS